MSKPTNQQRLEARIEALEECRDHLELAWTDDPIEREEGMKLVKRWGKEIERLADRLYAENKRNKKLAVNRE